MHWITRLDSGWLEKYVEVFVPISAPFLGDPKMLAGLISLQGFIKTQIPYILDAAVDKFNLDDFDRMTRSWRSLGAMMPMGDDAIYDVPILDLETLHSKDRYELFPQDAMLLLAHKDVTEEFDDSIRIALGNSDDEKNLALNPLLVPLPPGMKNIYCLTGIGLPTDVGYTFELDGAKYNPIKGRKAITSSEGDGTVPYISNGYLCTKGWAKGSWRNSGKNVILREFKHQPHMHYRRGESQGDYMSTRHRRITNNPEVIQAVLEIAATGKAENNIISDIREKSEEAGLRLNDTSKDAVFERLGITKDGIRSHEFGKRRDKKPEKESRRTPARSL